MEKDTKTKKVICPSCNGNGFIKIPYRLAKEEVVAQCSVCSSQGEIDEDKLDSIIIDADGLHRLQ
jgi:DnaJ-class molecular chaperone|tara:strand:+ start:1320 stop:1514 length:195 start_codon:yes stop_codon:yes gene_type:complete